MANGYGISKWQDAKQINKELKNLTDQPIYCVSEDALKDILKHFDTKCAKSKEITTEAKKYIPGGVQHNLAEVHAAAPELKFEIINFENTPENAQNILQNLGTGIDVVAGIFDETMLALRGCAALELVRVPICCAVSIYHPLAQKKRLSVEDLHGQKLMLMKRNWSKYTDQLRDELWANHPEIEIVDFSFYNLEAFNRCEHDNVLMMAVPQWAGVHPLLKILPVDWGYTIPFGLLHSPTPTDTVQRFLQTMQQVFPKTCSCE